MGFQKINKKGMQFKSALFAIVIVGLVIFAIGIWFGEWNTTYSSGLTYDLGEYNKVSNVSGIAEEQQGSININSANTGESFEGTSIRGVFGVLNNIYSSFRTVYNMIDSAVERFGLPSIVSQVLITLIIIAITFALVAIIFRLGRTSA